MTTPNVDSRPEPVGRVHWTYPRAVKVRENNNVNESHSAVYGTLAIYTDSLNETETILDNWEVLVDFINEKINEFVSSSA